MNYLFKEIRNQDKQVRREKGILLPDPISLHHLNNILTYAIQKLNPVARHPLILLSQTCDMITDIFRKTYNSDRFESVTKPASWSMLGSAGEDAILRELPRTVCLTQLLNTLFDILSF